MKYAKDGFSVEEGIKKGREFPEWYLNEPLPTLMQEFYLEAFNRLSTMRPANFNGISPIPWESILNYSRWFGLEPYPEKIFIEVIEAMDKGLINKLKESDKSKKGVGKLGRRDKAGLQDKPHVRKR